MRGLEVLDWDRFKRKWFYQTDSFRKSNKSAPSLDTKIGQF